MEQRSNLACVWINAGEVGALLKIALRTSQCEICLVIGAAVPPGDDVLDVETQGGGVLRQAAIFAAVAGPLSHEFADSVVHSRWFGLGKKDAGLGFEHPQQRVCTDNRFQFSMFRRGQLTVCAFGREFIVTRLRFGVGLDADQCAGQFKRQALRERSKQPLQCRCRAIRHARNVSTNAGKGEEFLASTNGRIVSTILTEPCAGNAKS